MTESEWQSEGKKRKSVWQQQGVSPADRRSVLICFWLGDSQTTRQSPVTFTFDIGQLSPWLSTKFVNSESKRQNFWVYQQFCPLLFWIILITIHIPIKSASNWTENDWVVHQDPDHRLKVSTFPVNPSTFNLLPENLPRISSPTCDITQISLEMFLSTPSLSQPPGQCTKSIVQIELYLNLESSFRVASRSSEAVDKPFIPC